MSFATSCLGLSTRTMYLAFGKTELPLNPLNKHLTSEPSK